MQPFHSLSLFFVIKFGYLRAQLILVLVLFLLLLRKKKVQNQHEWGSILFDIQGLKFMTTDRNQGWTWSRDYVGTLLTCSLIQGLVSWLFFLFSFFLKKCVIICGFHIMHSDSTYLPVPLYMPSAPVMAPTPKIIYLSTTFRLYAQVWHLPTVG